MSRAASVLFLPGASGNRALWKPVAARLRLPGELIHVAWPGLGGASPAPEVDSFDDLVRRVTDVIDARTNAPCDLVAQSMGAVVALHAALARPSRVRRLVLAVTAGGIDVVSLGAVDWRAEADAWHPPDAPRWFIDERRDLTAHLKTIEAPTLLLCGERDPLSPPAVNERFRELLPHAELLIVRGAGHDVASSHAEIVAPAIERHLSPAAL